MNKNKRLDYTLIAEGYAEYGFIPMYLRLVAEKYGIQVVPSKLGFKGQIAGKTKVLKEAETITSIAILQNHPLIIIGVDLDTADHDIEQPLHYDECQQIIKALGKIYKKYSDKIICFVTVQAIEQWLIYQAYKINLVNKANPNSLESKQQNELKKLLYNGRDNGPAMDQMSKNIAESADFDELAKQSRSFKHFHQQVKTFLESYQ
ncbi:hypothetical protein GCM10028807_61270 [Spirosoma daeguense]